jgi:hypothetical protein
MRGSLSRHFLNALSVIVDLAQKELAIHWRPMTMRMQLDINAAGYKLADFIRRQVVHDSLLEQRVIVDLQVRRQRGSKDIFLVGG